MVEMAISFTMVMFLLSGVVDLGRAFFAIIALRDAAQEGAVYASLHPKPADKPAVIARAQASSSNPIDLTDTTKVTVDMFWPDGWQCSGFTFPGAPDVHSYGVTVTIEYEFDFIMPLMGPIIPGPDNTITLIQSSTNTILYPKC